MFKNLEALSLEKPTYSPNQGTGRKPCYQTFYRKIKCNLLNFRRVKNGYHQDFQYLMASIHFFL